MKDLTGQRFGKLVVVKHDDSSTTRHPKWICQCDCGSTKSIHASALIGGLTNSCGCLRRETMDSKTRLHHIWKQMRHRALKHTSKSEYHFDRGITMCDEWANDFKTFKEWSLANGYDDSLSIDRINNDKGYYPDNCRWATAKQQVNNTRVNHRITFNGETHTVSEWAQILNVTPMSIFRRLYKGWSEEEALTIPRFGKRTIQKEPMTTQDIMNVCKQSISCGLCKNKKEFCEMSGISKYVFFSIQKGKYKISDGIYLKVKAMQDKILKIRERKEK